MSKSEKTECKFIPGTIPYLGNTSVEIDLPIRTFTGRDRIQRPEFGKIAIEHIDAVAVARIVDEGHGPRLDCEDIEVFVPTESGYLLPVASCMFTEQIGDIYDELLSVYKYERAAELVPETESSGDRAKAIYEDLKGGN